MCQYQELTPFRLSLDGPPTTKRLAPVVREPQKRKAPRSLALLPIRSAELHHPAFLRVNAQAKPFEALGQHLINSLGVAFQVEPHYKIIGKPGQKTAPVHPASDVVLEPFIQHGVQEDICKDR